MPIGHKCEMFLSYINNLSVHAELVEAWGFLEISK
jgi:hypothetical protein